MKYNRDLSTIVTTKAAVPIKSLHAVISKELGVEQQKLQKQVMCGGALQADLRRPVVFRRLSTGRRKPRRCRGSCTPLLTCRSSWTSCGP